jgi:hypothetical protein
MRTLQVIIIGIFTLVGSQLTRAQRFIASSAPVNSWGQLVSSANGMTLFAATAATDGKNPVYYSRNGGVNWSLAYLPSGNSYSLACSSDGTKVAAAMWYGSVYVSSNSGVSWRETSAPSKYWWDTIQCSDDGSTLVASVWGRTIYFSTDSGLTWSPGNVPSKKWSTLALSGDGKKCFAGTTDSNPLYYSADSGKTWTPLNMPPNEWGVITCSSNGARVIAMPMFTSDAYYTSTDYGATWTTNTRPSIGWKSIATSGDGRVLIAAEANYLYISSDSGNNWTACCRGINWQSVACSRDGSRLFAASNGGHIYSTVFPLKSWSPTSAPLGRWTSLCCSSDGMKIFGVTGDGEAYISSNAGGKWSAADITATNWVSAAASIDMSRILAIADGKIIQSMDGGNIWHATSTPLGFWNGVASSANGSTLIAVRSSYSSSVFVSHDCGTNWTSRSGIIGTAKTAWCSPDGNTMFTAFYDGRIYSSKNGGTNWNVTGAPNSTWRQVAASSNGVVAIASDYYSVIITTNSGTSWLTSSIPASTVACSKDGTTIIAAARQGPILCSTDTGNSWNAVASPYGNWTALAMSDTGNWFAAYNEDTIYSTHAVPLVFMRRSARETRVSWACSLTNYYLQTSESLTFPNWINYPGAAFITDGLNSVLANPNDAKRFFRLKAF